MAITVLQHVNPGDIISSQLVNYLIDAVIDLDQRLSALQAVTPSGPIVISTFEPAVEQAIGQVLVINGSGFLFPPEQNVVRIDSTQVTSFRPGSTSARLEFIVPPVIPTVPPGGRNVLVSVQNSTGGPVQRLYRLTPAVLVPGNPPTITSITRTDGTAGPLTPGQDAFINGTNFSTTANQNIIAMRFTVLISGVPTTVSMPPPPIVVLSATSAQLRVTLPAMPSLPLNDPTTLNVQVTVGAHPAASQNTLVMRTT
jgi:hypothetical protein